MTPAGELLRDEIARAGPVPFRRFMEVALYHPRHGYYRRGRDPFGAGGDYYTAEQVQPAFGLLVRRVVQMLAADLGGGSCTVVEPGAGRGEMAEFFGEFRYVPLEAGDPLPDAFRGVVFANEFFDALPVDVAVKRGDVYREMRVGFEGDRFRWVEREEISPEAAAYLNEHAAHAPDGATVEIHLDALAWIDAIAARLEAGYLLAIDYGYTSRELVRFPEGTLMSYRKHVASSEVLRDPGERDITAHVPFTAIERRAERHGFRRARFESLASLLLRAGEEDQFAEVLEAPEESGIVKRRLQLKQLLFGMGETFRALLMRV